MRDPPALRNILLSLPQAANMGSKPVQQMFTRMPNVATQSLILHLPSRFPLQGGRSAHRRALCAVHSPFLHLKHPNILLFIQWLEGRDATQPQTPLQSVVQQPVIGGGGEVQKDAVRGSKVPSCTSGGTLP